MQVLSIVKRFFSPFDDSFKSLNTGIGCIGVSFFLCTSVQDIVLYICIGLFILFIALTLFLLFLIVKKRRINNKLKRKDAKKEIEKIEKIIPAFKEYCKYSFALFFCVCLGYLFILQQQSSISKERDAIQQKINNDLIKINRFYNEHANLSDALPSIRYQADSLNNKHAQVALGFLYFEGFSKKRKPDYKLAKHYLSLASNQEHPIAQYQLGYMYHIGYGEANKESARLYLIKSADNGYIKAQAMVGQMYVYGDNVQADGNMAEKYLTLAAENNDAMSQFLLAVLYEHNNYKEKFYYWMERAALNNYKDAQDFIAAHYIKEKKYKKAIDMFNRLIMQKDVRGYLGLGTCYENGYGIDKNLKKAEEYYLYAYDNGVERAECNLASFYYSCKKYKEAEYWCNLALNLQFLPKWDLDKMTEIKEKLNNVSYEK